MTSSSAIRTFAWLSHERPDALKRSVTGLTNALGDHAGSYQYLITQSGANQSRPDYIPSENLLYIDDEYRNKLINYLEKTLIAHGFPPGVASFALDVHHPEGSEGSHRNAISLLTQGQRFICTDDDVIFDIKRLSTPTLHKEGIGGHNFFVFKDADSLQEFEGGTIAVPVHDFIRLHEIALQKATFSSPGIRGDSAYGGPRFIFNFGDAELGKHFENPNFTEQALSSRLIWRETPASHIVPYAPVMTYMLGMNGEQILPPCFPFSRNVDGVFIYSAKALNPNSQTAHLQASILHRPISTRNGYPSLDTLTFRINDLLWLMWSEWLVKTPHSLDTEARYLAASSYFNTIASLSPKGFDDYLTSLAKRSLLDRAKRLKAQTRRLEIFDDGRRFTSWVSIADKEIDLCQRLAAENTLPLPSESDRYGRSPSDRSALTRYWIRVYGHLLQAWPLMRQATLQQTHSINNDPF